MGNHPLREVEVAAVVHPMRNGDSASVPQDLERRSRGLGCFAATMYALRHGELLQFGRGERAILPHRLQGGVLGPGVVAVQALLAHPFPPFPSRLHERPQEGELLERDRAQHLVPVLEPQPLVVHKVEEHPRVGTRHARLEDEVVVSPQDREGTQLHGPEVPERGVDDIFALGIELPVQADRRKLVQTRLLPRPVQDPVDHSIAGPPRFSWRSS